MDVVVVFHSGLIGTNYNGNISVAGSYSNDSYNRDGLKVIKNIKKKHKDKNITFSVPNRFIRTLTERKIDAVVHRQQDIKEYLKIFNYLEQYKDRKNEKLIGNSR